MKNAPFCPISASVSSIHPKDTSSGAPAVKIFGFLEPGQNWTFFKGLNLVHGDPEAQVALASELSAQLML